MNKVEQGQTWVGNTTGDKAVVSRVEDGLVHYTLSVLNNGNCKTREADFVKFYTLEKNL